MIPSVLGLDLSLTATGVAWPNGASSIMAPPKKMTGVERLAWFRYVIGESLENPRPDLVVVEGYSFGTPNNAHHAGELGGVVQLALYDANVAYVLIAPGSLKKFATGKGNANKDAMLVAAVRAGYQGNDNNEADAWWLRQMGLYHCREADVARTAYRDESVVKVTWPASPWIVAS